MVVEAFLEGQHSIMADEPESMDGELPEERLRADAGALAAAP